MSLPGDDAVLAEMDRRCWSELGFVGPRPEPGEPFFDATHRPCDFLVPVVDGKVGGYLRLVPATSLESNAHVWQIQGLLVDEWARGLGAGRALLDAAVQTVRGRGGRRLTLRVLGHNAPARRLYERAGFVVEGVLPEEFLISGGYVDDVLMGRRVDLDG
ncbi:N-acetyltransferase [Wenjunlia tyrosinilytica]|uniref:N-acetyltransferase n=2 Tax=Wenjunlia tyrosinilytica TaxID=1544741 RepID=A0A918DS07_9ACTN|nr:N-acetyltransferase [Wenjunlia tyrosinilytica]